MKTAFLTSLFSLCLTGLLCQPWNKPAQSLPASQSLFASNSGPTLDFEVNKPPIIPEADSTLNLDSLAANSGKVPYKESLLAGMTAADTQVDGLEWGVTAFLSGLALNVPGAVVLYLSAAAAGRTRPVSVPDYYNKGGYKTGFSKRAVFINRRAALVGGALGAALQTILLIELLELINSEDEETYRLSCN